MLVIITPWGSSNNMVGSIIATSETHGQSTGVVILSRNILVNLVKYLMH